MRRVLSLALAVLLMMTLIPATVFAAETITVTSDKSEVAAGDEFTLTVKLPDTGSLGGFEAFLNYDAGKVAFVSATKGGLVTKSADFSDLADQPDNSRVFILATIVDEGTWDFSKDFFTVTFKVLDGAEGSVAPELAISSYFNYDMDDIEATVSMAEVAVAGGEVTPDPAEDETKLVAPVIDPAGKTLKEDGDSVDITISCATSGAAIYYQLGDAEATLYTSGSAISLFTSGGAIYTSGGAINLGKSVVLKAWAMLDELKSDEASATFEIKSSSGGGGGGGGSTPAPAEDAFPFKDVPANAYFRKAVEWAWKNGVTAGTTETTFSPYIGATRGQMVTYLWAAAGCPEPSSTDNPFTDVAEGAYYYKAVLWAVEKGITAGTSATTFSPDQTVTRGQAITFLYGAAGRPEGGSEPFVDVNEGDYFAAPVAWAYSKGITVGINETEFGPAEICQRCQIVQFLYLYYAAE